MADASSSTTHEALLERVAALEAALEAERSRADAAAVERDRLREAYRHLQLEVELMRLRLVVAKAERIDTAQLQLEFAAKLAARDALGSQLAPATDDDGPTDSGKTKGKGKRRSSGRRDLRDLTLPEERIEISDPGLEGTAPRIGTEDSCRLMWRRGGSSASWSRGSNTESATPPTRRRPRSRRRSCRAS